MLPNIFKTNHRLLLIDFKQNWKEKISNPKDPFNQNPSSKTKPKQKQIKTGDILTEPIFANRFKTYHKQLWIDFKQKFEKPISQNTRVITTQVRIEKQKQGTLTIAYNIY